MLRLGAWFFPTSLFLLSWSAVAQDLSDSGVLPAVDTITPVPGPDMEIPFGSTDAMQPAMPKDLKINNQGGRIEGDINTGMRLSGPVKIEGDNGLEMFSDTATLDLKAETVTLTGNVTVYQGNTMQRGEQAVYHYATKFLDTRGLRASMDPILLEAGKFTAEEHDGKRVLVGHDAGITTNDVEDPNYWIRAKKTTIYPGDKIVFNSLKLYAGDTPVFWFPYLEQPLDGELGYHFTPGARSNWGAYLLNTYGIMLGGETDPETGENNEAWLLSRWHLDLRTSRGIGTGVDLVDTRLEHSGDITGLSLYYLNDLDPSKDRNGIPRGFVNEDRYKVEFKHRITPDLPGGGAWWADANLTWLSDRYYLEDFDLQRYNIDPAPDNTLGIYRRDDKSLLSLYARFQTNDFYRADTRLPEITFDQARAPFSKLPVLHEGTTSLGYIGEQASDPTRTSVINPLMDMSLSDPSAESLLDELGGYERQLAVRMLSLAKDDPQREAIRTQLLDSSYVRFHTYHEWSMPMQVGGFLSITPEAGVGYTRYDAVAGPESSSDDLHLHIGVENSLKFSRDYGNVSNHFWGLDGLMHVLQPYSTWSVVSSDDYEAGDPAVDRLTPTTRPRTIDPIRFTAIDQMNSWNILRLGARNRLITRRDGGSFEWMYLDTYVDAFIEDPEADRDFSNLYNDVRWQPLPWLGVYMETQFPIASNGSGFSDFSSYISYQPTDRFDMTFGYRWLSGHPVLVDSSRILMQTYTRLTENWGFGTRHELELDDSTLEYQQYTFHRDLGNWVVGMGVSSRDNRYEQENSLVFSLTLKDFPALSLPIEMNAQ